MPYDFFIRRRVPLKIIQYILEFLNKIIPQYISEKMIKMYEVWTTTLNFKVASNIEKQKDYKVFEIENFLSDEECDLIIKLAKQKGMIQSTVINDNGKNVIDLYTRNSKQTWLEDIDNKLIKDLSNIISKLTDIPTEHQENLQIVSYEPSNYYKPHYDASYHPKVLPNMNYGVGPRLYTFIIYLNDNFEGGETEFPELGLKVKPQKGKAILFQNINNQFDLIPESLHGGCPVSSGTKWIANKWIRIWPVEMKNILKKFDKNNNTNKLISPNSFKCLKTVLYHNILTNNSPICFYDKENYVFIEIDNFLNLEICDNIMNNQIDISIIDNNITNYLNEFITVPMDNSVDNYEKINILTNDNKKQSVISPYITNQKQRFFSMYIFINDNYEGGSFYFPNIDKTIIPKKGKAIIFMSIDNSLSYDPRSLCIIEPVLKDKQIILEKHIYVISKHMKFVLDKPTEWVNNSYEILKDKEI